MGVVAAIVVAAGIAAIVLAVWHGRRPREAYRLPGDRPPPPTTAPARVVCREVAEAFPTGFETSRCLALGPDGSVWVSGDFAVRRFDAAGRRLGEIAVIEPPGALAVDADGVAFVATGGKVMVYAGDGERRAVWPPAGDRAVLTAIALAGDEVFVADAGNRAVLRYDKSGKLIKAIGRKDPQRNVPGFQVPSPYFDLAMAPDGLLRVANPGRCRIEAYTVDGDLEASWGRSGEDPEGFSGCCNPANFALLPARGGAGRIEGYVTAEKGRTRVKLHDADGKLVGLVAGAGAFREHDRRLGAKPAGRAFLALDVAVAPGGRIFVLDPVCNEVRAFERTAGASPAGEGGP